MASLVDLLNQFAPRRSPATRAEAEAAFENLDKVMVVATSGDKVIGSGAVILDSKLNHKSCRVGHIEDVIVHPQWRRQGVGQRVVGMLVRVARKAGCYKVVLHCSEDNVPFYESCEFNRWQVGMRCDLS